MLDLENVEEIYKQLTNVDIKEQQRIWDERGKGYFGEYLVFCKLYQSISGTCKILMNLNIPTEHSKTTEIDLLLIHETGLYIFEIKHYKGTIYGKDDDDTWTQYFRTSSNSVFKNPIQQNGYHINALVKLIPNVPIHSVIVFTNDDCELKVENKNPYITICKLQQMEYALYQNFSNGNNALSAKDIDEIFNKLSIYSPMTQDVIIDGEEKSFFTWINPIISSFQNIKEELKREFEAEKLELKKEKEKFTQEFETEKNKIKKQKTINRLMAILIVIVGLVISVISINSGKTIYNKELNDAQTNYDMKIAEFAQKFKHIDEIDNEYINELNSYINVSDVSLKPLTKDAVSFNASISLVTDIYGISIPKDAKYIVMTDDGQVFEYDYINNIQYYNSWNNTIGKYYSQKIDLSPAQFYGISNTSKITYIKLTGITLMQFDGYNNKTVKENLELELYSK